MVDENGPVRVHMADDSDSDESAGSGSKED